jgi:hypothetical protein
VIITTMMVPRAFGLQGFTQWGGMYIDGWCHVAVTSAPIDPEAPMPEGVMREELLASSHPVTTIVWFAPMHTSETCTQWGASFCSTPAPDGGWRVEGAYPYFRGAFTHDKTNACDRTLSAYPWFTR